MFDQLKEFQEGFEREIIQETVKKFCGYFEKRLGAEENEARQKTIRKILTISYHEDHQSDLYDEPVSAQTIVQDELESLSIWDLNTYSQWKYYEGCQLPYLDLDTDGWPNKEITQRFYVAINVMHALRELQQRIKGNVGKILQEKMLSNNEELNSFYQNKLFLFEMIDFCLGKIRDMSNGDQLKNGEVYWNYACKILVELMFSLMFKKVNREDEKQKKWENFAPNENNVFEKLFEGLDFFLQEAEETAPNILFKTSWQKEIMPFLKEKRGHLFNKIKFLNQGNGALFLSYEAKLVKAMEKLKLQKTAINLQEGLNIFSECLSLFKGNQSVSSIPNIQCAVEKEKIIRACIKFIRQQKYLIFADILKGSFPSPEPVHMVAAGIGVLLHELDIHNETVDPDAFEYLYLKITFEELTKETKVVNKLSNYVTTENFKLNQSDDLQVFAADKLEVWKTLRLLKKTFEEQGNLASLVKITQQYSGKGFDDELFRELRMKVMDAQVTTLRPLTNRSPVNRFTHQQ